MGSSFAAGAGLGARAPGSPLVSYRSSNGYPQQLARLLGVASFTDMSSSGSTVMHVIHGGQYMLGPQVDALGPDTRLVTLTAGGNDIAYIGDLAALATMTHGGFLGRVLDALGKTAKPIGERDFAGLAANLRATIQEIRKRSPQARIVVVTYPVLLPKTGTCPALGISAQQAALMRAVGEQLAHTTSSTATAMGATVVDMNALSAGHDVCSSDPWVNGFGPTNGDLFHPNLAGARATAQKIAGAIGTRG